MTQAPGDVPRIDDWSRLLADRVAVVTGGGDGIGGAISRLSAQHGACRAAVAASTRTLAGGGWFHSPTARRFTNRSPGL